jgi:hypothetical protein
MDTGRVNAAGGLRSGLDYPPPPPWVAQIGVLEAWDEGYEPSYLATENELPLTMVATSQSIGA